MYVVRKKGFPMNLMLIFFKQIVGLLVDKVAKCSVDAVAIRPHQTMGEKVY
jgi:hypothetical protein